MEFVDAVREELKASPDVLCAWVFGSTARRTATESSDVDLALLLDKPPSRLEDLHSDLADRIERRIKRPVDLSLLNSASVDLVHRVLRDGILLIDRNPSVRIQFEVDARNRYFDMLPIWHTYRAPRTV